MQLKCSLHIHTTEEPEHWLFYNAKQLIDEAANQDFDVLAFTCHKFLFYPKNIIQYAKKRGITLIPGIEASIKRKHVVILNATMAAASLKTFDDLERYKKNHPDSMIIAAHPFFPGTSTLKKSLKKYINLFDGVELCHFYTKQINFKKP